jgi:hypothetical protein
MFDASLLLAACMFLGAALYTSVGHAGASAYIAFMALFSVAPAVMRPTALTLNILVASFTPFAMRAPDCSDGASCSRLTQRPAVCLSRRRHQLPGTCRPPSAWCS